MALRQFMEEMVEILVCPNVRVEADVEGVSQLVRRGPKLPPARPPLSFDDVVDCVETVEFAVSYSTMSVVVLVAAMLRSSAWTLVLLVRPPW